MSKFYVVEISGRSDDTTGAYGLPANHYFNWKQRELPAEHRDVMQDDLDCGGHTFPPRPFTIWSESANRGIRVVPIYDGRWSFALSPADLASDPPSDESQMPDWLVQRSWPADGYSEIVRISVSLDTVVFWGNPRLR